MQKKKKKTKKKGRRRGERREKKRGKKRNYEGMTRDEEERQKKEDTAVFTRGALSPGSTFSTVDGNRIESNRTADNED